ncbi:hypothetical protein J2Z79_000480 [Symbiobacterium terraclitae]|uniref:Uncharacterized protein n=1 Tax=Symbiobacterium terraclitae TaxID=557451 RepID=A0ABS4JQ55_9FIRM|nr:hypothetical protein [Symbiobacterium terraclitae]MBP2017106.1 hypothetical protein [Symbiobacterium terraclitae]
MTRLLVSELILVLLSGAFAALGVPWLSGRPASWPLFLVGVMMAMAFVALYAVANLAGGRLRPRARLALGAVALALTLWRPLDGATHLVGAAAGLLLAVLGAALGRGAGGSLYAFAVPLLGARWLLAPLLGPFPAAQLTVVQCGAFYCFARGLIRLWTPTAAEGNPEAGPLVRRPVPDRVVGLVEGISRRRARPYATREDGSRDDGAVSVLCPAGEAPALLGRLQSALAGHPVTVSLGPGEGEWAQLVVRTANEAP